MTDDDPDLVDEIRATRRKIMKKCKTWKGFADHMLRLPPAEKMVALFMARMERVKGARMATKANPFHRKNKAQA